MSVSGQVTIGDNVELQNEVSLLESATPEESVFSGAKMLFTNVINPQSAVTCEARVSPDFGPPGSVQIAPSMSGVTTGRGLCRHWGTVVASNVPDHALVVCWICGLGPRSGLLARRWGRRGARSMAGCTANAEIGWNSPLICALDYSFTSASRRDHPGRHTYKDQSFLGE